jgi:hypothetical protein
MPGHPHQPVAILYQQIAAITQLRFFAIAFARQPGLRIGLRFMRLVAPLLTVKVHRRIARIIRRRLFAFFPLITLQARPGFQ